jgi:transposase InsO family protein
MDLGERAGSFKFLIRDRDSKFTALFDEVFRAEGIQIMRTAAQTPRMNAIMERWVGSVRRESLDRIFIVNAAHLRKVLTEYEDHRSNNLRHLLDMNTPAMIKAPTWQVSARSPRWARVERLAPAG